MTKAILFDLDGVIVNSILLWLESEVVLLKRKPLKAPLDFETYAKQMKFRYPLMVNELKKRHDLSDSLKELRRERYLIIRNLYDRRLKLMPGFLPLVKRLREKKYKLGIGTSTPRLLMKYVIKRFGLKEYFDYYLSSETIGKHKPEPDVYLRAASQLKVSPKECIVIEDSQYGILAAKRAGMRCIAVRHPYTQKGELARADRVVNGLKEVTLGLIGSCEKNNASASSLRVRPFGHELTAEWDLSGSRTASFKKIKILEEESEKLDQDFI